MTNSMDVTLSLIALLIIYQLKHFIADYLLQGKYMLGKFKSGWDFFFPLFIHADVHALFTFVIALFINPAIAVELALTDAIVHFMMDRIKAGPKYLGKYKSLSADEMMENVKELEGTNILRQLIAKEKIKHNVIFWWSLGLDQMVHHLTHYYLIFRMLNIL